MSKSIGNVIEPQKVIDQMGADVLRLWIASADYRDEMSVSDDILKRAGDAYRRIRNTARFLLGNLHGFDPARDAVAHADMLLLDQWALHRAHELQAQIRSEEHTSELQSLMRTSYAVFCLKKKKQHKQLW